MRIISKFSIYSNNVYENIEELDRERHIQRVAIPCCDGAQFLRSRLKFAFLKL